MGSAASPSGDPERSRPAFQGLIERIVHALGHDLRTPLGTIVNYASILEDDVDPNGRAIRDAAARIRKQAAEIADASQLLSDSLQLAAQPPQTTCGEPVELLRSLADEIGAGVRLRPLPPRTGAVRGDFELEPRLIGLAWRAFLSNERSVRSKLPDEAELRVSRLDDHVEVELGFDGALEGGAPVVPLATYLGGGSKAAPLRRLAFEVGGELIACRGGALELVGAPGRAAAIRIRIPQHGSAAS